MHHPLDIDALRQTARARLIARHEEPTALRVYYEVAVVRGEMYRQSSKLRVVPKEPLVLVAGGCIEETV